MSEVAQRLSRVCARRKERKRIDANRRGVTLQQGSAICLLLCRQKRDNTLIGR